MNTLMQNLDRPLAVIDFESTGTNPQTDRIIEVCIVRIESNGDKKELSRLVNPQCPVKPEILELTHITQAELDSAAPFSKELANHILELIAGCAIGGFNVRGFDLLLLEAELDRLGIPLFDKGVPPIIDAGMIFKRKEPRDQAAALLKYCGATNPDAHRAGADALDCYHILVEQTDHYSDIATGGMSALENWSRYDGPKPVDLAGNFVQDAEGVYFYNFGKFRGLKCADNPGLMQWMLGQNFPRSTKAMIPKIRAEIARA